jgi:hypothetical protein
MGEVTPPAPRAPNPGADGLGIAVGLLLGLVGSVFASVFLVVGPLVMTATTPPPTCGQGILIGTLAVAGSAAFAAFAWYMLFRNRTRSFVAGLFRGLSIVCALYFLIPWPCGLTWLAVAGFGVCGHH